MDGISELFNTILGSLICFSPCLCVGIIGVGAIIGYMFIQNQNKSKTQALLDGVADMEIPGIDSVVAHGTTSEFRSANTLVQSADILQQITRGDSNLVRKQVFNKINQDLRLYLQSASYGTLSDDEFNQMRREDISRINAFAQQINLLGQAVSDYDGNAARNCLVDIDNTIVDMYEKHLAFRAALAQQEVEFPIPMPAQLVQSSQVLQTQNPEYVYTDLMQRLPDDKQMMFMMQFNNVKKNPQVAVLLAVLLGGVGAHKFYMGDMVLGLVYILFSWTSIPMIVGVIEAFFISNKVHQYNARKATEIAYTLGLTDG
ncbi:TM2 domain-containing protein [Chloroflexota bacterium]